MKTQLYRAVVDGRPITMLSISGLTIDEARDYCRGIFGDRLESLTEF